MTTLVMRSFRALLRPNPRIISSLSRRSLPKEVGASSKTEFGIQEDTFGAEHNLQTKGGQLDVQFMIKRITKWLNCSPKQAENILVEMPSLRSCHLDSVNDYINYMKDMSIDRNLILQNPWLLNYSLSTMRERITLLSEVGITQTTIHLLQLETTDLTMTVKQWISDERSGKYDQNGNRLEFFSKQLQCTEEQLAILMKKVCTLLTSDFDKVMAINSILLDHGITPSDIFRNLNIFKSDLTHVRGRLEAAHLANVAVKIWMIKTGPKKYLEILEKWRNTRIHKSTGEYVIDILTARLKCTRDEVISWTKYFPQLSVIQPNKLNQKLDLFHEFGFSSKEICNKPLVLTISVKRIQRRLQELKQLRLKPADLRCLFLCDADFQLFVKQLQSRVCV